MFVNNRRIDVADMDGGNRRVFLESLIPSWGSEVRDTGLTIVYEARLLCFSEKYIPHKYVDNIYMSSLRGACVDTEDATRRLVFDTSISKTYFDGVDLTNDGERFYWPDNLQKDQKFVLTAYVNGTSDGQFELLRSMYNIVPNFSYKDVTGIAVLPRQCPTGNSVCGWDNGDCQNFCFARQDGSKVCADAHQEFIRNPKFVPEEPKMREDDRKPNVASSLSLEGEVKLFCTILCVLYCVTTHSVNWF